MVVVVALGVVVGVFFVDALVISGVRYIRLGRDNLS